MKKLNFLAIAAAAFMGTTVTASAVPLANFDGIQTGTVAGGDLSISAIGASNVSCSSFSVGGSSAGGNALCGNNVNPENTLTFSNVDFDTFNIVQFSLGTRSNDWENNDYLIISVGGNDLVTFSGDGSRSLKSSIGNTVDREFVDFSLDVSQISGQQDLVFRFLNSSGGERFGIDTVTAAVPLPAGVLLLLSGLGGLGLAAKSRRRAAANA